MTTWIVTPQANPLLGYAVVPGDKSIAHRALLLGGLADGASRIRGVGGGGDNRASARAMRAMGVAIAAAGEGALRIDGVGLYGLRAPAADGGGSGDANAVGVIECGNSGTTMRLLCGLLAGQDFGARLVGDASLSRRPMRRVAAPLARMGARITSAAQNESNSDELVDIFPPLDVIGVRVGGGRPVAIDYAMPIASAQVKSALLLCALYADGVTRITEPGAARDHTERMLLHMGAPIRVEPGGVIELDTRGWDRRLVPRDVDVPADPSQAAFLLAAGLIAGVERITCGDVCVNPRRTGFLDVLSAMGANVEREAMRGGGLEPVADLSISRGSGPRGAAELTAAEVAGDAVVRAIDELPILAVVAARARGATRFRDAGELRVKESDRIATTVAMLRALGVDAAPTEDGLTVVGDPERPFAAATIDASGDHRIAMSAAIAGLVADGPVRVTGAECVDSSYPGFAEALRGLGATVEVVGGDDSAGDGRAGDSDSDSDGGAAAESQS